MINEKDIKIPDNEHYRKLGEYINLHRSEGESYLIHLLHHAQGIFGYLPPEVQYFISKKTEIPLSKITGVISFYHFFRTEPIGKYLITACLGTACHVKGAKEVLEAVSRELNIKVGGTTSDGLYTISTARCFGGCGLAPVITINEEFYGRLSIPKALSIIREHRQKALEDLNKGNN